MKRILLFIFYSFCALAYPQQKYSYPTQFFINPLKIDTEPSGTFAELRGNHFHSGFDFKTQKKVGFKVYAVADGYISRIKYSTFGYGKAIYVTHYNGFTTVYGHLQGANPEIEKYIRDKQYANQTFEIELFPKKDELRVNKGQLLAYSGNSGGSGGPHLHFEYRDTASEEIINPLFFGIDRAFKDTTAPVLKALWAYPLSDSSVVSKSASKIKLTYNKLDSNAFITPKLAAQGPIGFAINAYDLVDGHYNHNGIYKLEMFVNGALHYSVVFDRFNFAETRYINSYIDYEHKKTQNETLQKLFYISKFPLSLLAKSPTDGIVQVLPGQNYNVLIQISDFNNNKTQVTIPVVYSADAASVAKPIVKTDYFVKSNRQNVFEKENVTVTIPKNAFVDDFHLNFDVQDGVLMLHKDVVPAYQNMTIAFDLSETPFENVDAKKIFIAETSGQGPNYLNTFIKNNKIYARTKNLGTYQVLLDTIPPKIYGLSFKDGDNLEAKNTLKVNISDHLSGIKKYSGFLNGKWILMDYDYKTNSLIHNLDDGIYQDGENHFKLEVTDLGDNQSVLEARFIKSKPN